MVRSCLLVFVACIIGMAIENKHCYARNKPTESRTPKYEIVEGNDGQSLRFVLAEETFRKGIMCYIQPKFGNQIIIIFSDDESQQTYNEICELLSKNSVSAAMVMENATIEVVEGNTTVPENVGLARFALEVSEGCIWSALAYLVLVPTVPTLSIIGVVADACPTTNPVVAIIVLAVSTAAVGDRGAPVNVGLAALGLASICACIELVTPSI